MRVDSITNGLVIDHIIGGKAMQIYELLNLSELDCSVAVLQNMPSKTMPKKDIIKIDSLIDINIEALGFISPSITVNIIKNGEIIEKKHIELPDTLTDVLTCKNPRCITSVEQDIHHIFKLTDRKTGTYRCIYCDTKAE